MEKRGQVTAFFIAGLVILVIVLAYFGISYLIGGDLFKLDIESKLEIPEKIKPVKMFMDSCVGNVAERGLSLMATGGGYIHLPEDPMPISPFNPIGRKSLMTIT